MKTAIITGGAVRLGRAIALGLAECGWNIGFTYFSSEDQAQSVCAEIESKGVNAFATKANLRLGKDIAYAFGRFFSSLGPADLLVNNAGIFPAQMQLDEISTEVWDETHDVNLRAQFLCSQHFAMQPVLPAESRIINLASRGAFETWKNRVAYNVSKAAVVQLTKSLARELAPRISVNCIAPGYIQFDNEPTAGSVSKPPVNRIPMGRFATPADVFSVVQFFSSCPQYITGQTISVDGGSGLSK